MIYLIVFFIIVTFIILILSRKSSNEQYKMALLKETKEDGFIKRTYQDKFGNRITDWAIDKPGFNILPPKDKNG